MEKVIVQERRVGRDDPSIAGLVGGMQKNYRYDCTAIKMVKPENKRVADAQTWAKSNMWGRFRMWEEGVLTDEALVVTHYFTFDDAGDAAQFKLVWG